MLLFLGGGFDPVKFCMRTRTNLGMNSPNDQLIGIENPDLHPAAPWGFWASKCVRSLIQDQKGSPFDGFLNLPSIGRGNSAFYHFGKSGNRQWKLAFCRRFHSCFECGQLSVQSSVFFPGDEWGSAPLLLPTGVGSWIFLAAEWHYARGWWHWETYHYRIHFFLTGKGLGEPFSEHFLPPAEEGAVNALRALASSQVGS